MLASELIDGIESGSLQPTVTVVDPGDCMPRPKKIWVTTNTETHECELDALLMSVEDVCDSGKVEAKTGDVTVTAEFYGGTWDDAEIDGIEYDDELDQDDVIAALNDNIDFPESDDVQFDPQFIEPFDLEAKMQVDGISVFAVREDDTAKHPTVYGYASEDDFMAHNGKQKRIPQDKAFEILSNSLQHLTADWA